MSRPEYARDLAQQGHEQSVDKNKKSGLLVKMREWLRKKNRQEDVETLAAEVGAEPEGLKDVIAEVAKEVEVEGEATVGQVKDMQESLREEAPGEPAIAELEVLVGAEQDVVVGIQEEIKGVELEVPSEAKEKKVESLFERVAGHATEFAGFDEVVARLDNYQNPDRWGGGSDKEQLITAFKDISENSFCFGSWDNGRLEVFFTDAGKNLKKTDFFTLGDLAHNSVSTIKDKVRNALEKEGWRGNSYLAEIAGTVSEQKRQETAAKELEEKREKIARGEFGKDGIGEFLADSKSVVDLETLRKAFKDFKGSSWEGDPEAEDLKKAMEFFDSLPVGACQMDTSKGNFGVSDFNLIYKAGNGELKKTNFSIWDMDKRRQDEELGDIVNFSESATRGSQVDDRVMKDRVRLSLEKRGFTILPNLFGDVKVPLYKVLKSKE